VPLHGVLEGLLDTALPRAGRLFPHLSVDRVVKRYAYLCRLHPELHGTVFHSTRKWYQSKKLTASMIDEISFAVVNGTTIDPRMSFALYSGRKYMLPGNKAKRLWRNGYCDLNEWVEPTYRHEEAAERDEAKPLGSLQERRTSIGQCGMTTVSSGSFWTRSVVARGTTILHAPPINT
jgi:hypothetical protein